jgi:hypothetical protein
LHRQKPQKGEVQMKRFFFALALTCALASSSFAGDVPSVGITPPPPPPPDGMQASTTTALGEIPSGGLTYQITDASIDLIQMLLGFGV